MLDNTCIKVENLTMSYGPLVVQKNLTFSIDVGDIFIIMGGSGCGKSTLLRHMVGLKAPHKGKVELRGEDLWSANDNKRTSILSQIGVMYQYGALWSSMTIAENISLPLQQFSKASSKEISELASLKLSLVGLCGFENFYPHEISGGMRKRAALARAIALDPEIIFLDEPSAGLDPISSRKLDELILQLKEGLGSTFVVVTHELASIFTIGNNGVFLDADSKTMLATGSPQELLAINNTKITSFLNRGETNDRG